MAYRLDLDAPLADQLRRTGLAQFERIARHLGDTVDTAAPIHEARKAIKRLRALLGLMASAAPRATTTLDRRLRRLARGLAMTRDRDILAPTYTALLRHYDLADTAWPSISADLASGAQSVPRKAANKSLLKSLDRCRAAFVALPFERGTEAAVHGAVADVYAAGRRQFRRLDKRSNADEVHDWRKSVQRHWRHMQLLEGIWPREFEARLRLARDISERLGHDHDLDVLGTWIADRAGGDRTSPAALAVGALIDRRQRELRKDARRLGRRLHAENRRAFARRLRIYAATRDTAPDPARDTGRHAERTTIGPRHIVPFNRPV